MSTHSECETAVDNPQKSTVPAGPVLLALGLGGMIGFATVADDWISTGFLFLVLCVTCLGYRNGATRIAASVMGMLIAIRYAGPLSEKVAANDAWMSGFPTAMRQPVLLLASGCLIAIVVYAVVRIVSGLVLHANPQWNGVNRWLGAALGAVQGVVISLLLLFSLMVLEPIAKQQLRRSNESQSDWSMRPLWETVVEYSPRVRQSSLGGLMNKMEPIQDRLTDRVHHLADSLSLESDNGTFLSKMHADLLEKLRADPDGMMEVLANETGLDEQSLRSLLNAPDARQDEMER